MSFLLNESKIPACLEHSHVRFSLKMKSGIVVAVDVIFITAVAAAAAFGNVVGRAASLEQLREETRTFHGHFPTSISDVKM